MSLYCCICPHKHSHVQSLLCISVRRILFLAGEGVWYGILKPGACETHTLVSSAGGSHIYIFSCALCHFHISHSYSFVLPGPHGCIWWWPLLWSEVLACWAPWAGPTARLHWTKQWSAPEWGFPPGSHGSHSCGNQWTGNDMGVQMRHLDDKFLNFRSLKIYKWA